MPVKNEKFPLYSDDGIGGPLAQVVKRIAGRHDGFVTDYIGTAGENGAPALAVRLQAWRLPDTDSWSVKRLTYVPSLKAVRQSDEARPGLCFMDALALCIRFQKTELDMHEDRRIVAVDDGRPGEFVHFTEAAKAAGQVIDREGKLHPCVDGHILTEGLFDQDMLEIAATTRGIALLPAMRADQFITGQILKPYLSGPEWPFYNEPDDFTRTISNYKLSEQFDKVVTAGNDMMEELRLSVNADFKAPRARTPGLAAFYTAATLGVWPAFSMAVGGRWSSSDRFFITVKNKFLHQVEQLPDCREKSLSVEFARAAEGAFWLERAACLFESLGERSRVGASLMQGAEYIRHAAAAMEISEIDATRLEKEFLAGKMERYGFLKDVDNFWYSEGDPMSATSGLKTDLLAKAGDLKRGKIPEPVRIGEKPCP